MSIFTQNEMDYLRQQRLGRFATVDADGDPHVVPVGFRYNSGTDTVDIGGHNIVQSKKWRDVGKHPIEILADVELLEHGGEDFGKGWSPQTMRLHPVKIIAWGIDTERQSRNVKDKRAL